jgi:hypothetical protein
MLSNSHQAAPGCGTDVQDNPILGQTAAVICILYPFLERPHRAAFYMDDLVLGFLILGTILLLDTWFVVMDRKRTNRIWRIVELWLDAKEKELERRRDGKL